MAILVEFELVRKDGREVEYAFGHPPDLDRRLVIEKATGEGAPRDGRRDMAYAAAFRKIIRFHHSEQRWPSRGGYAA
ncbi:hypothetical protein [Plantactinospora sp. B5E13]|uniref:hypothetical protein n=1 Tax=unclassified Plantactinospora TaxID=2631981 RepID=UPI00325C3894